jgi:malate dehydrogenase (oxaloacetate-decarboxylating)(NADP+)
VLSNSELHPIGALSLLILDDGPLFVADTHVNLVPTATQMAETVIAAARHVRRFGVEPRIALCSGSQFGNLDYEPGRIMRSALGILRGMDLNFQYEGEMHTDAALDPDLRARLFPNGRLTGKANVLIYSNTDAAGATRNILKSVAGGIEVGPILMGMGNRVHIVTPSITVRGLLNTAALAGSEVSSYG